MCYNSSRDELIKLPFGVAYLNMQKATQKKHYKERSTNKEQEARKRNVCRNVYAIYDALSIIY